MMDENIIEVELKSGLCNKIYCFFSACDIAIKNNIKILEPKFGWPERSILFSDIYDLDKFNQNMKPHNNGHNLIIPHNDASKYTIKQNNIDLWDYSKKRLESMRRDCMIPKKCTELSVLRSLELNKKNKLIAKQNVNAELNALQIRIESDWQKYNNVKTVPKGETLLIDLDDLIEMYKKFTNEGVFFSTGENHINIKQKFISSNISANFFFNPSLEYEVNAAINFEVCCQAKHFIGLSRSTFSNLITLKRFIDGNGDSFVYNLNNEILRRTDAGLQADAVFATTKKTYITN